MDILAVNGSPRKDGSTATALNAAVSSMGGGDIVNLGDLRILHCRGCDVCKEGNGCIIDDDMSSLYRRIRECDFLMISSPIYFGEETGLFKNFLDRFYAFVTVQDGVRKVNFGRPKKGSILLTCGAQDGDMRYQNISIHLMDVMKSMGISDLSYAILPGASPDTVLDTDFFKDYLDALDFQMM